MTCRLFATIITPWIREVLVRTAASVELLPRAFPATILTAMSAHPQLLVQLARVLGANASYHIVFSASRQTGKTTALIMLAYAYAALHTNRFVCIITCSRRQACIILEIMRSVITRETLPWKSFGDEDRGGAELPNGSTISIYFGKDYDLPATVSDLLLIDEVFYLATEAQMALASARTSVAFGTPIAPFDGYTGVIEEDCLWTPISPCKHYELLRRAWLGPVDLNGLTDHPHYIFRFSVV